MAFTATCFCGCKNSTKYLAAASACNKCGAPIPMYMWQSKGKYAPQFFESLAKDVQDLYGLSDEDIHRELTTRGHL